MTARDALFLKLCKAKRLPEVVTEHRFHPERRWRWDFAFPERKVAVECNGGVWLKGRSGHSSGIGLTRDYEKWSHGAALGWRIIHVTPSSLNSPTTLALLEAALL